MKISYLLGMVFVSTSLASCSSMNTPTAPVKNTHTAKAVKKNPLTVSFYQGNLQASNPYTVVGIATVSKYNHGGFKRQEAIIHDKMRDLAASMGGDAIINIKQGSKTISGTVISYQPKIFV